MEQLVFEDISRASCQVILGKEEFTLWEPDEGAMAKYQACMMKGASADADGDTVKNVKPGEGAIEARSLLVALCLKRGETPVSQDFVKGLKPHIVAKLYDKARSWGKASDPKGSTSSTESTSS